MTYQLFVVKKTAVLLVGVSIGGEGGHRTTVNFKDLCGSSSLPTANIGVVEL